VIHLAHLRQVGTSAGSTPIWDYRCEIALRWGFAHLGRFAVEYRQRFGESSPETLGRR
jgi:hypothetical protein